VCGAVSCASGAVSCASGAVSCASGAVSYVSGAVGLELCAVRLEPLVDTWSVLTAGSPSQPFVLFSKKIFMHTSNED